MLRRLDELVFIPKAVANVDAPEEYEAKEEGIKAGLE